MKQLELPGDAVVSDATEFLRAWITGDNMEFVSLGNIFPDAAYIGIFAADVIRHIVSAGSGSEQEKLAQVRRAVEALNAEFS
jgi:hypothetical protein